MGKARFQAKGSHGFFEDFGAPFEEVCVYLYWSENSIAKNMAKNMTVCNTTHTSSVSL